MVVGDSSVGKTGLIDSLSGRSFNTASTATIGQEVMNKEFVVQGQQLPTQIWDTAGQERFRCLPSMYYQNARAVVVVFDITSRSTFEHAPAWLDDVRKYAGDDLPAILVGSKLDLADKRRVTVEEGRQLASLLKCSLGYHETSSKTGDGVYAVFHELVSAVYEQHKREGLPLPESKSRKRLSKDAMRAEAGFSSQPRSRSISSGSGGAARAPWFREPSMIPETRDSTPGKPAVGAHLIGGTSTIRLEDGSVAQPAMAVGPSGPQPGIKKSKPNCCA